MQMSPPRSVLTSGHSTTVTFDTLMNGFTDDARWITGATVARGHAELRELFTSAMTGLLPALTIQDLLVARIAPPVSSPRG